MGVEDFPIDETLRAIGRNAAKRETSEPAPTDLPAYIKAEDAKAAARQRSITRPPRPPRRTKLVGVSSHAQKALNNETEAVRTAVDGKLNDTLNIAGFNLGQLVGAGTLDFNLVCSELRQAAITNGYPAKRLKSEDLPERAVRDGMERPRDMSNVGTEIPVEKKPIPAEKLPPAVKAKTNGFHDPEQEKSLKLKFLTGMKSRVPTWVWEYDGVGRIQHGTLTMFAGKPAAGKSTAVRWFAARLSKGELPGVWFGHPMRVALIMAEEQTDAMVLPGLQAAGADTDNICIPQITIGDTEFAITTADEAALTEELLYNEVSALFIDPIMSTFSGKADIYRNNEVRAGLAPFTRIASAINGIVVGVTHLRKGDVQDVLGGINGSSAFGEVPRAVFGFAPTEGGNHVMEQVKNSAGPMGLKLCYQLPIQNLMADDGQPMELPRFEIIGETEVSISDLANDGETTGIAVACEWLNLYLLENQPAPSAQVKRDAKQYGDIGDKMIGRAAKRLGVIVKPRSEPEKPHTTIWCLPGSWEAENDV